MSKRDARAGKPAAERTLSTTAERANQHVSTPKQELFLDLYLDPKSATFGNAYQSALSAGYSEAYAKQIKSPAIGNEWLQDNPRIISLTDKHIHAGVDSIATDKTVKPADRLKAYELSAKLKGLLVERKHERIEVISVSLGSGKPETGVVAYTPEAETTP